MGTAPGNEQRGAPGNGHGSDKTPTTPETNGNSGNVKGNGQDKDHANNGLHVGQKNGKENPGQGRDRRSDTANAHAQDVYKNPTLTGEHPGQGSENRSEQAGTVARNVRTSPLVITEGDASAELGGDTSGGESVEGVTATASTPTVNGQSEFIWYYHPDHLGSTGFVTDQNGELYEHVEYFPFGETWVQEHSNTQRTPYLYTGKELDEETGLYYYGARYYDPRTSVWQSADPIIDKYLPSAGRNDPSKLPGLGGAYNTFNINLYCYAAQNPVKFVDPDGKSLALEGAVVIGLFYVAAVISNPETQKQISKALSQAGENISSGIESTSQKFRNLVFNDSDNGGRPAEHGPRSLSDDEKRKLSEAGRQPDPADKDGRTKAGRAAQKHGSRPGSAFPTVKGRPEDHNEQGQDILNGILNDPGSKIDVDARGRATVTAPDGRGARYNPDGSLQGFREPKPPGDGQ
jgi:RHS repeat-associated protein